MSHNVMVSGVQFTDMAVLAAAVNELVRETGTRAEFKYEAGQTQTMRGYGGRMDKVDAVIHLPDQRYDIGLRKQSDGTFVPFFESGFHAPGFAADYNAKPLDAKNDHMRGGFTHNAANSVGKLVQRYAVIQAERNARNMGLSFRRATNKTTGQLILEVQ